MADEERPHRARVKRRRRSREKGEDAKPKGPQPDWGALVVFALMVTAAPLAFGAVDRVVQLGLLALFAVGLFLKPPAVVTLSRRAGYVVLALAAMLVLKEILPAAIFGHVSWRSTLTTSYGLAFPWTHHPELGRALDVLLAGCIGVLWLLWVRTLAVSRENRPLLAWSLFGSAVVVAAVSFATQGIDPHAIYGLRYTQGWRGFGPFPNRNHTASFLAMGLIVGFGCLAWAGARRKYWLLGAGVASAGLPLAALMVTQSRGGLIAFAIGSVLLVVLLLCKLRSRRALALIGTAAFAAAALVLAFGAPLFARFAAGATDVSKETRRLIWSDAAVMWRDAPLFGHGAGEFTELFPMYQRLALDDQVVLHPESSWLQWLTELGLIPVGLAAVAALWCLPAQIRQLFARHHGFYLMAAGLAAGGALLAHCVIDVPGHRWATAGFGLAALALAMPVRKPEAASEWDLQGEAWQRAAARSCLIPLAVAAFWATPFLAEWPSWSPQALGRIISQSYSSRALTIAEVEGELASFPLSAELHHLRGVQELLREHPRSDVWLHHFRLAQRLLPGSWSLAVSQARACQRVYPRQALGFWQQGIERSGLRNRELLGVALEETKNVPGAEAAWATYVEAHPELALAYASRKTGPEAQRFFQAWWRERGSQPDTALAEPEIRDFYALAPAWATAAEFAQWMREHPDRVDSDYRSWAAVLHARQDDPSAWRLLTKHAPEPAWPDAPTPLDRAQMELRFQKQPGNIMNAQALATSYFHAGQPEEARRVIVTAASFPGAPSWFIRKGAYQLAAEGKLSEAVGVMLRETDPERH